MSTDADIIGRMAASYSRVADGLGSATAMGKIARRWQCIHLNTAVGRPLCVQRRRPAIKLNPTVADRQRARLASLQRQIVITDMQTSHVVLFSNASRLTAHRQAAAAECCVFSSSGSAVPVSQHQLASLAYHCDD